MADVESAQVGDLIEIHGHRLGEPRCSGEILEVLGTAYEHYRVRWEDGHESFFTPGSDAVIRRVKQSKDDDPGRVPEH
jgi:hypothetical protein